MTYEQMQAFTHEKLAFFTYQQLGVNWIIPKTNWMSTEYINAIDYNRIKNDQTHIYELARTLYNPFLISDSGVDKTHESDFFADEFNILEDNLEKINSDTYSRDIGNKEIFSENGTFIDYVELNRLEGAILLLYKLLQGESQSLERLSFRLGAKGGIKP